MTVAILLSAPNITIGGNLQLQRTLRQRHPPELVWAYGGELLSPGRVRGVGSCASTERGVGILLDQESDGVHCRVAADNILDQRTAADCLTLLLEVT